MTSTVRAGKPDPLVVRGRNRELAILEVVVREARPAVVRGRPGAGVTTILDEAARRAATDGVRVGRLRPRPWAASPLDLIDELEPMLEGRDRVLVVLDDADLCDPAQRAEVVRRCQRSRAPLLVGAHDDVPEISDERDCTLVDLGCLERAAVADLVGDALGERLDGSSGLVSAYHRASGGSPAVLSAVLDDPALRTEFAAAESAPDPTDLAPLLAGALSASVHQRLAALDPMALLAVGVSAVAGPFLPAGMVEDAVGPSALARAVESGLVVHTPDGTPAFRHGAVRRLVLEDLPAAVHADVRRRLLEAARAHGLTVVPEDVLALG